MKTTLFLTTLVCSALLCLGCGKNNSQGNGDSDPAKSVAEHILESTDSSSEDGVASGYLDTMKMNDADTEIFRTAIESLSQGKVSETIDMLEPLVEKGRPKAIYLTGIGYEWYSKHHDKQKSTKFKDFAIPGLEELEKQGDPDAIYYLGHRDLKAKRTAKGQARLKAVFPAFLKLANGGDRVAKGRVADLYYHGWGTQADRAKAFEWFKKSASDGNAHSNYMLGFIFADGKIVPRNLALAEKYFQVAIKNHYAPAMVYLGWELSKSSRASDREKGVTLLVQAKMLGEPQASGLIASALKEPVAKAKSGTTGSVSRTTRKSAAKTITRPRNQDELKSFAKRIAKAVGRTIMDAIGGGQDLVVNLQGVDYDSALKQYEIDIQVSFNGAIFRTDNYRVAGRVTVNEDGSNAKFARTECNENYREWEGLVTGLKITAAVVEVIDESSRK